MLWASYSARHCADLLDDAAVSSLFDEVNPKS